MARGALVEPLKTEACCKFDNHEMSQPSVPVLNSSDLVELGRLSRAPHGCATCSELVCPGWESLSSAFPRSRLQRIGTLRRPGVDEPTLREHHPAGTHSWSPDAPIAPEFFPYNRYDVWQCVSCARAFLRYTEFGGYYEDERIRELNAELVDDASA